MSNSEKAFTDRLKDIAQRSSEVLAAVEAPQFSKETGAFLESAGEREEAYRAVLQECPIFEALGKEQGVQVMGMWGSALREYANIHGEMPRDEVLASAHKALETLAFLEDAGTGNGRMLLESVKEGIATTEGIEIRAKMAGLILPVLLQQTTQDCVTYIPADRDKSEIFEILRVAGSTFGDLKAGDVIDQNFSGQYTQMLQRYEIGTADGNTKTFTYNPKTGKPGLEMPFRPYQTKILINRQIAAQDLAGDGELYGTLDIGGTTHKVTGNVTYSNGDVSIDTGTNLPANAELAIEFEVDIEKAPSLIPTINHTMRSFTLRPTQTALAGEFTIQSLFTMSREFSMDLNAFTLSNMRNLIAGEKDRKVLSAMDYYCTHNSTFSLDIPETRSQQQHYELIRELLLNISTEILTRTKISGMRGMFCGTEAANVFKSLGSQFFEPAPGYVQRAQPHYCGLLFGMFRVYEDPSRAPLECMCYGRGAQHTQAGYVAGDAVPAVLYDHTTTSALTKRSTLWELSYGSIHPRGGADYFHRLTFTRSK